MAGAKLVKAGRCMEHTSHSFDHPERCHFCQKPLESPIGCMNCHSIFPSQSELTHFDRLGLPARFDIAPKEIERAYLAWSRELHPDYFQTRSPDEQALSLKLSAALNDAYATLSNPFRRAEYLLHLLGGPNASEHRSMPEGFLETVLDLRMEIEEAKDEGRLDDQQALHARLQQKRTEAMGDVAASFRSMETAETGPTTEELASIRERLNTVKYYDGLIREMAT